MKLNHLDLFSGIGGFSLGLEATGGFETKAFCDIEEYPRQVLQKHWPHVKQYKDIKELNYERLKADGIDSIDIITGGYPCQPFSVAGLKKGEEDPRHLWPEYFRLIKECRPTWVIGENVPGHIKLGLDTVIKDLESEDYSVRPFSISAASVGANHQRERIWIVAYSERNYNFNEEQRVNGEEKKISREHREDNSTTGQSSRTSTARTQSDSHVVNSDSIRSLQHTETTKETSRRGTETSSMSTSDVANTNEWKNNTRNESKPREEEQFKFSPNSSSERGVVANTNSERGCSRDTRREDVENVGQSSRSEEASGWWDIEPNVGRVAHGIPKRVDRLKGLGNSLIPQIPYYLGTVILEVMNAEID